MKRFSIVNNGYDINEVNRFIDIVIKRLEKLNAENEKYASELEKIKTANSFDSSKLEKAILAIEETSDRIKENSREEARVILEEAKNNANSIIHEALIDAQKTEQTRILLEKNMKLYKERVKAIMTSQLSLIDDLDKLELE